MTPVTSPRARALGAASSLLVVGVLLLAGCSSAAAEPESTSDAQAFEAEQQANGAQGEQRTPNGVSGLIAYAEDGLLQVQSADEQTAVRYTSETTLTKTTAVDAATIVVGDCVTIITDEAGTTATTVAVSAAADDGTCSAGFGGGGFPDGGGGFPGGEGDSSADGGERPEGMPSGRPTDAPDGDSSGPGGGMGQFVAGAVTAVGDGTITVESTGFGDDAETTTSDVALTATTTVTGTVSATADDVVAGVCVSAFGEADDAGGYDATALTLSDADENGECSTARGAGFPGGGAGGPDTEDEE